MIYTTNTIENPNHSPRKVLKNRNAFPTDDALLKVLYLGLKRTAKKWQHVPGRGLNCGHPGR